MKFGFAVAALLGTMLISGCVQTEQVVVDRKTSSVGPGPGIVDSTFAATLFKNVCVATRPSFERGRKNLSKAAFAKRDPKTDIYYHQGFDLSFKIGKLDGGKTRGCSMVFASREKPQVIALFFGTVVADATSRNPEIFVSDNSKSSHVELPHGQSFLLVQVGEEHGRKYYQAVIAGLK